MPPSSPNSEISQKTPFLDTLVKIATLLVSTTWIFFLLGWLYLDNFYGSFGITSNTLDLPFSYAAIFSVMPLSGLIPLFNWALVTGFLGAVLWIFQEELITRILRFPWIGVLLGATYISINVWVSKHKTTALYILGIGILLAIAWGVGWLRPFLHKFAQPSTLLFDPPVPAWVQRLNRVMTRIIGKVWLIFCLSLSL